MNMMSFLGELHVPIFIELRDWFALFSDLNRAIDAKIVISFVVPG